MYLLQVWAVKFYSTRKYMSHGISEQYGDDIITYRL